jgi:hypothetical protein
MTAGRRDWRDRPAAHLTRHFFGALFDLGFLSREGADAFIRVLLGIVAVIFSFGLLLTRIYLGKYAGLKGAADPAPYLHALAADTTLAFGLPMWVAAFITVLISHSLVPDETDFRVLSPLPVTRAFIFGTKLLALAIFNGIFIGASLIAVTPLVGMISSSRHAPYLPPVSLIAYWIVGTTSSVFSVLAVVAVIGLLTAVLPRSRVHGVTAAIRSTMLVVLMLAMPFVFALPADADRLAAHARVMYLLPPAWFLGVERLVFGGADAYTTRLGQIGLAAFCAAAGVSLAGYLLLYARFDRVMLRSMRVAGRRLVFRVLFGRNPWRAAVLDFTHATLRRSSLHQGVLLGVTACGVALALNRLADNDVVAWLRTLDTARFDVVLAIMGAPWLLMLATGMATRAALALPIEQRANWVFRMTENESTRVDQLRAVTRIMRQTTVGLTLVLMAPFEFALFGPRAIFALATNAACALLWVEVLLHGWRRIPFTCSYMPGKLSAAQATVIGIGLLIGPPTLCGALAVGSARSPIFGVVVVAILGVLTAVFARARIALWNCTPLEFDDKLPSAVEGLMLN